MRITKKSVAIVSAVVAGFAALASANGLVLSTEQQQAIVTIALQLLGALL
jgi:hypothetical protein